MKICVVGAGHVGLVVAAGFAETGNDVICADLDQTKIERLRRGELVFHEPGLEQLLRTNTSAQRLTFTTDAAAAVSKSQVVFVAVGTPPREDGGANLKAIDAVAEMVGEYAAPGTILTLKSTVPVGTNARVRQILARVTDVSISVVSNPEFLREGTAVNDFMWPDRIVIGCDPEDESTRFVMARLHQPLLQHDQQILWLSPSSAELTKYVANAMLAMRISFMNEVASLCEQIGADVDDVRRGVGSDRRIGANFLHAGPGYGGSCFPKDVKALIQTGREHGIELELPCATERVNERQKGVLLLKLKREFDGDLHGRRIAVLGVAFKPLTDDIRESPALTLIDGLISEGADVVAHDPAAGEQARAHFGDTVDVVDHVYDAVAGADALVLVTDWRPYRNPDFARIRAAMRNPLLLDGRNVWARHRPDEQGFRYVSIGRADAAS